MRVEDYLTHRAARDRPEVLPLNLNTSDETPRELAERPEKLAPR